MHGVWNLNEQMELLEKLLKQTQLAYRRRFWDVDEYINGKFLKGKEFIEPLETGDSMPIHSLSKLRKWFLDTWRNNSRDTCVFVQP